MTARLPFRRPADLSAACEAVAAVHRAHGVVTLPTETFYGLAVPPEDGLAVARVFEIKGRPAEKALLVVVASLAQAETLVEIPGRWRDPLASVWPAPLTVVLPVRRTLPAAAATLAIRVPAHELLRELLGSTGPLTATSANPSGSPPISDPDLLVAVLGSSLDLVLDGGTTPGGLPSTVLDLAGRCPRVLREGAWRVPDEWK
jgi:L-threonylcarbamoyladenylate synthase